MKQETGKSFDNAYDAGFDAGVHGPNTINSHFKWFMSKENMQEWERGKANAQMKNAKHKK